ncbi:alpha/beta hydrolase [Streptosporangium sp. NPDC002721]|uniref:alpha/beta hydrolase n=1 Tax=Streptosporangium sp. NPDC002721 TaxID=3366188 RepID=UPI0036BEE6B4
MTLATVAALVSLGAGPASAGARNGATNTSGTRALAAAPGLTSDATSGPTSGVTSGVTSGPTSGVTSGPTSGPTSGVTSGVKALAAPPGPAADARLERFIKKAPKWRRCGLFRCATLTVPVDYAHPDNGRTFTLPLIKAPASKPDQRIGTLVAAAGGPGQSGTWMVRTFHEGWPAQIRERFDVVGFDPRGVGGSKPAIDCGLRAGDKPIGKPRADLPLVGEVAPYYRLIVQACARGTGKDVLPHVGTANVVTDLELLRAALRQDKINFLGYSYGTNIGQRYADRFPHRVRAMVLDGIDTAHLDWATDSLHGASAHAAALRSFARACARDPRMACPATSAKGVLTAIDKVIARARTKPLRGGRYDLDADTVRAVIGGTLIDPSSWRALSTALGAAADGDGTPLADLRVQLAAPSVSLPVDEVTSVVNCLDRPHSRNLRDYERLAGQIRRVDRLSEGTNLTCAFLPSPAVAPTPARARGAGPIVLISHTRDARTPYRWAREVAGNMPSAVLLTYDADGHTVYATGLSSCVDDTVTRYLVDLTPPRKGARCGP